MTAPLYLNYDPLTRRSTEVEYDPDVGLVFTHTQSTLPIVESAKRIASHFDKHAKRPDGFVHVARIPMVVFEELQRLGITKDEKAFNNWLNSRECRFFRTDDGRKL